MSREELGQLLALLHKFLDTRDKFHGQLREIGDVIILVQEAMWQKS